MQLIVLLSALVWLPVFAKTLDGQPEDTVRLVEKTQFVSRKEMVVAAHPLAVEAGAEILRDGGSAVDAMVAVQMVLNLVEPQSSGIGGGAFILHHDAETQHVAAIDGREVAPALATEHLFLDDSGEARPWPEVVPGGLSVGVPGTLALMKYAHAKFGRLSWGELFDHAIQHAEMGFPVSARLAGSLHSYGGQRLKQFDEARRYFFLMENRWLLARFSKTPHSPIPCATFGHRAFVYSMEVKSVRISCALCSHLRSTQAYCLSRT